MHAIVFIVGLGLTQPPHIKSRDELWHARFYDRDAGQFYCGNGATAWEAVAWSLVERAERSAGINRMARTPGETPFEALAKVPAVPVERTEREPVVVTSATVHLPIAGVCTPETKQQTAAARRARAKKGGARG